MPFKTNHSVSIDIMKTDTPPVVRMKQGDRLTREVTVKLLSDGEAWAAPSDVSVLQLAYCKSDKVGGCYDHMPDNTSAGTFNPDRTAVTMQLHPQVLNVAGDVTCELRLLTNDGEILNAFNFIIYVQKSPIAMTSASEGYYNNVFDGATFIPHISPDGTVSWTNNKNLPNPAPVNVRGPRGPQGEPGDDGARGALWWFSISPKSNDDAVPFNVMVGSLQAGSDTVLPGDMIICSDGYVLMVERTDRNYAYCRNEKFVVEGSGSTPSVENNEPDTNNNINLDAVTTRTRFARGAVFTAEHCDSSIELVGPERLGNRTVHVTVAADGGLFLETPEDEESEDNPDMLVRLRNIREPRSDDDAANKKYVDSRRLTISINLISDMWQKIDEEVYEQTVNVTELEDIGEDEDILLQCCPAPQSIAAWKTYGVQCMEATEGTMTFRATTHPAENENISVIVVMWR